MKEKQGFTLIELLAVIVILAIIALISTPIVLNIINTSRKGASITSARGYIRAVNNEILANEMDQVNMFQNGTYNIDELLVEVSGNLPENGTVTIDNDKVSKAELCFNGYLIKYDGTTYEINGECKKISTVTLNINESKENKKAENLSVEFNIENYKNGMTNISCNNGATLSIDGNILKGDNVFTDTECNISASLTNTITELDDTENYILMINDETLSDSFNIAEDKKILLNLNGRNLINNSGQYAFNVYGILTIYGKDSSILGTSNSLQTFEKAELIVDGGTYNSITPRGNSEVLIKNASIGCTVDKNNCYPMYVYDEANIIFENVSVTSLGKALGLGDRSTVVVKNSQFKCTSDNCIYSNSRGSLNIYDTTINSYGYALRKDRSGTVNLYNNNFVSENSALFAVTGNQAESSFNIYNGYYEVLAEAALIDLQKTSSNGMLNIYRGEFDAAWSNIANVGDGILNINGGKFNAGKSVISNSKLGVVNICDGIINGTVYDISNEGNGYVYYKDSNIFKNNILNDSVNNPSHIILNSNLNCEQ